MVYSDAQPGPSNPSNKFTNNTSSLLSLPILNVPHDVNYRRPASICLTEDLLSRFGLFEQFQRQVLGHGHKPPPYSQHPQQPHLSSIATLAGASSTTGPSAGASGGSGASVGVGRGHSQQPIAQPQTQSQAAGQNGLNDDPAGAAKKEKKREKELYKSLFKNLPGKHDTKRDHYLSELLMQPPKETRIMPLDDSVAEIAFTIFDVPQPVNEDEENKKRKKKRKREQEQQASPSVAPTPGPAHLPTPGGPTPGPLKQTINMGTSVKREAMEMDPALSQRPTKRPRQENYPLPAQQPTPVA